MTSTITETKVNNIDDVTWLAEFMKLIFFWDSEVSSASPKFPFSFESGLTTTSDVSGVTNSYFKDRYRARSYGNKNNKTGLQPVSRTWGTIPFGFQDSRRKNMQNLTDRETDIKITEVVDALCSWTLQPDRHWCWMNTSFILININTKESKEEEGSGYEPWTSRSRVDCSTSLLRLLL